MLGLMCLFLLTESGLILTTLYLFVNAITSKLVIKNILLAYNVEVTQQSGRRIGVY